MRTVRPHVTVISYQAKERMEDLPHPDVIREEMLELLLKYKQFPTSLQRSMAQRIYFETLSGLQEKHPAQFFLRPRHPGTRGPQGQGGDREGDGSRDSRETALGRKIC